MNKFIGLKIGALYLALPGQEVSQINLSADMEEHNGLKFITFQNKRIPVVNMNEQMSKLSDPRDDGDSQLIVTLAYVDKNLVFQPRFALQVNKVLKMSNITTGLIPSAMKKQHSPLEGWYQDSDNRRGFLTSAAPLEQFINHLTENMTDEYLHSVAN